MRSRPRPPPRRKRHPRRQRGREERRRRLARGPRAAEGVADVANNRPCAEDRAKASITWHRKLNSPRRSLASRSRSPRCSPLAPAGGATRTWRSDLLRVLAEAERVSAKLRARAPSRRRRRSSSSIAESSDREAGGPVDRWTVAADRSTAPAGALLYPTRIVAALRSPPVLGDSMRRLLVACLAPALVFRLETRPRGQRP